eukprot:g13484.t1
MAKPLIDRRAAIPPSSMQCCSERSDRSDPQLASGSVVPYTPNHWWDVISSCRTRSSRQRGPSPEALEESLHSDSARSKRLVSRHIASLPGKTHLLAYSIVHDCESGNSTGSRLPRAHFVPCNTTAAVPIENENFKGEVLLLYRPTEGLDRGHPYYEHFRHRKRNWELRLQGKFKKAPRGQLFVGAVLRDFNYDQPVASSSILAMNTAITLVKYQYRIYFSWGARCQEALRTDAELGHAVSDLTVFDQIIITPNGRPIPHICSDLDDPSDKYGLSLMRRDMGLSEYSKMIQEIEGTLNTEEHRPDPTRPQDTYTFRLWGPAPFLDVLNWQLKMGARDFPIHVCMYDLPACHENGHGDPRHLESKKRYYFDFMGWSNAVTIAPVIFDRYVFHSAPEGFVMQLSRQFSNNSFHSLPSGSFMSVDSTATRPFWRRWIDRLRWIPKSTCNYAFPPSPMRLANSELQQISSSFFPPSESSSGARLHRGVPRESCDEALDRWGFEDTRFEADLFAGHREVYLTSERYPKAIAAGGMVNGLWSFFGQMHGGLKGHAVSSTVDQVELVEADPDAVALLTRLPNISLDSKERLRSGTGRGLGGLWSLRNGCSFLRMPDLVVKPRHEDDVLTVLQQAAGHFIVIPVGGRTGITSATTCPSISEDPRPVVSLDLRSMDKLLWVREEDRLACVEAGITGSSLKEALKRSSAQIFQR